MTILTLDSAIPFDSYDNGAGVLSYYGEHAEAGYVLTGSRDDIEMISWDQGFAAAEGFHYDGPGVLATAAYESVTLSRPDGESFALRSIALDTQWAVWKGVEVTFEGWTDSGVVLHSVVLDNAEGLQEVVLPDAFSRVTSVTWLGAGPSNIQFDDIDVALAANQAPVSALPIPDQQVAAKHHWQFKVPASSFADADHDALTLSATLAGGSPLPDWLSFVDGVFSGTPAAHLRGVLDIEVTATDQSGASASQEFSIALLNPAGRGNPHQAGIPQTSAELSADEMPVGLLGIHATGQGDFGA